MVYMQHHYNYGCSLIVFEVEGSEVLRQFKHRFFNFLIYDQLGMWAEKSNFISYVAPVSNPHFHSIKVSKFKGNYEN